MLKIVTVTLPAAWASALINNDWSGLNFYDPDEAQRARDWLRESGLDVISCSDQSVMAQFDGVLTECLEYQCVKRK